MMGKVYASKEALEFLSNSIPIAQTKFLPTPSSSKMKFPFILKINSPFLLHKTEFKAVKKISNDPELQAAFKEFQNIIKKNKLKDSSIIAQEYCEGEEILLGIKDDAVFRHVLVLGIGGIFTEVFKDTSIRKCPISNQDAEEMISDLKGKEILYGARKTPLNLSLLKKTMISLSKIPLKHKKIKELDINPFILSSKLGKAVDARIIFN